MGQECSIGFSNAKFMTYSSDKPYINFFKHSNSYREENEWISKMQFAHHGLKFRV
jgi:hypothetical protein